MVMNCEIQNIVAHSEANLKEGQVVDIKGMYETHSINCTFQKSMFPGLVYRMKGCPVVMLCFCSGKVVLTGGKRVEDIESGWKMLWSIVKEFIIK
jgi:transcription initiation factor TFIID TATA-box-binding protein